MRPSHKKISATVVFYTGIIALIVSLLLPAFEGVIFDKSIVYGWQVFLLTLSGAMNVFDGRLELILAGLFASNVILLIAIAVILVKGAVFRWLKVAIFAALFYVLFASIIVDPGEYKIGFFLYIASYLLIGTRTILNDQHHTKVRQQV